MSETLKSKLSKLEAKIQPKRTNQEHQELTLDLAHAEYLQKFMKMTMTPEELQRDEEQSHQVILKWYIEYLKQSPEEQKIRFEQLELEGAKDREEFKVWRDSPERVKFDEEYAKRFGSETIDS